MGNCCNKPLMLDLPSELEYSNSIILDISGVYGSQVSLLSSDNSYTLPSPIFQNSLNTFLGPLPIKISGAVLPGMDFRNNQSKTCQDEYAFIIHNGILLCVLCDGHGTEGHHISKFAVDYSQKFFKKHFSKFKLDPKSMTTQLLQKCDKEILQNMECDLSGTTIVMLYIDNNIIYCGSLGDSRAVLGMASEIGEDSKPNSHFTSNKYFRRIKSENNFKVVALTMDQKPENNDEMLRIRMSGGVVEKYTDAFGRSVGPYRVWNRDGSGPGLAMSRSLGDKMGKGCGVISSPVYLDRVLIPGRDQYIVIGSDGLWDVMENIEVIHFVDKWKGKCESIGNNEYPANNLNSSISRLLCEEARFRWLGIAEKERVAIDDISCIIVDFVTEDKRESVVAGPGEQKLIKIDSSSSGLLDD